MKHRKRRQSSSRSRFAGKDGVDIFCSKRMVDEKGFDLTLRWEEIVHSCIRDYGFHVTTHCFESI